MAKCGSNMGALGKAAFVSGKERNDGFFLALDASENVPEPTCTMIPERF